MQLSALMWLKTLMKEQWHVIVAQSNRQDMHKLLLVQAYISKKTSDLDNYVQLKGKMDLARKACDINPAKASAIDSEPLVYKDESDDEELGEQSDDSEEIKEIPLGQASKRRQVDQQDEYDMDSDEAAAMGMMRDEQQPVDDSVSSYTSRSDDDESMASDVSDGVDDGLASSDGDQRIDDESESDQSNVIR